MIVIYDKDECPFCYRVRLCMGALGLAYERRAHHVEEHAQAWRALTNAGTVPVFVHDDVVLTDSWVILEYLQDRFGGLLPEAPAARARVRELTRYADAPLGRALREVVFEKRGKPEAEWDRKRIATGVEGYYAALPDLEAALGEGEHFGGAYSFADAALTGRFALAVAYGVPFPEHVPKLRAYFAARSRDAFFSQASPERVRTHVAQGQWDEGWGRELTQRVGAMWGGDAGVPADDVIETLQTLVSRCAHGGKH